MKPPTAKGYFQNKALVPEIIVQLALTQAKQDYQHIFPPTSKDEDNYFIVQAETWLRWFHANKPDWRWKMERESNKDRDYLIMFARHWAIAFLQNPEHYKKLHPIQ